MEQKIIAPGDSSGVISHDPENVQTPAGQKALSDTYYRQVVDQLAEAFVVVEFLPEDRDFFVLETNRAFAELLKLNRQQILGRRIGDIFPNRETLWDEIFARVAMTGAPARFRGHSVSSNRDMDVWAFSPYPKQCAIVFLDITPQMQVEDALRTSEEKYRQLAEAAQDQIFVIDRQGCLEYVNTCAARQVGLLPEQMAGMHYEKFFPSAIAQEFARKRGEIFESGEPSYFETAGNSRGDGLWWGIRLSPLRNKAGRITGVLGISRDISVRKHSEKALLESEARYRALVDLCPVPILVHRDFQVLYANRASAELFGARWPQELRTRHLLDLIAPQSRAAAESRICAMKQGEPLPVTELLVLRLDGRQAPVEVHSGPIMYEGVPTVLTVAQNISARNRHNELIAMRRELAMALASGEDFSGAMNLVVEAALLSAEMDCGGIYFVSDTGEIDLLAHKGFCPDYARVAEHYSADSPQAQLVRKGEPLFVGASGMEGLVPRIGTGLDIQALAVVPIFHREQVVAALVLACCNREDIPGSSRDALEALGSEIGTALARWRAEAALRDADRRKDEFLAMLAHELRNPLMPVRNALELLKRRTAGMPELSSVQEILDRQVSHLTRLVEDLLDVSRVSCGKIELRIQTLDFASLVQQSVTDHRALAQHAGLRLECSVPAEPVAVLGDSTRLAQAVGNLLHNAVKFTDSGGEIHVSVSLDSGRFAELRVRDNGIGMTPETCSRIFETFSQADHSLDRSRGGLGLGLALVKKLAGLHGGTAYAESAGLGKGALFTLRLPLSGEPVCEIPAALAAPAETVSRRILVIEDHLDGAESLRMLLELSGHEVRVAFDGESGLEAAESFRPDVILCDVGLPGGLNGYEVAERLRRNPAFSATYLAALTGYGDERDRRRAYAAGFDRHFTKPVDPAALTVLLSSGVLERSAAGADIQ